MIPLIKYINTPKKTYPTQIFLGDQILLSVNLDHQDLDILTAALPAGILIETHLAKNIPLVQLSPSQFNQTLMNLAINARDAMNGKGTLTISLRLTELTNTDCSACHKSMNGPWVELAVSDTGILPKMPIILCSGYSEHFSKHDAKKMNIRYLAKPIDIQKLLIELKKLTTQTKDPMT